MGKEITVRGKNQNYTDYEKFIKKKKDYIMCQ